MEQENKLITIFKIIISCFKKKDKAKEKENSNEAKRVMCGRAIQANVCPHQCEICAWNVK